MKDAFRYLKLYEDIIPDQVQILISSDLNIINEAYNTLVHFYYENHKKEFDSSRICVEPSIYGRYTLEKGNHSKLISDSKYDKLAFKGGKKVKKHKSRKQKSTKSKKSAKSKKLRKYKKSRKSRKSRKCKKY